MDTKSYLQIRGNQYCMAVSIITIYFIFSYDSTDVYSVNLPIQLFLLYCKYTI